MKSSWRCGGDFEREADVRHEGSKLAVGRNGIVSGLLKCGPCGKVSRWFQGVGVTADPTAALGIGAGPNAQIRCSCDG
jgi:hypothetical protein